MKELHIPEEVRRVTAEQEVDLFLTTQNDAQQLQLQDGQHWDNISISLYYQVTSGFPVYLSNFCLSNLFSGHKTVSLQLTVTAETGLCQVGGQSFLVTVGHLTLLLRFKSPAGLCLPRSSVCVLDLLRISRLSCLNHQIWKVSGYCWQKVWKEDLIRTETKLPGQRVGLKHQTLFLQRDTRSETRSLQWNYI